MFLLSLLALAISPTATIIPTATPTPAVTDEIQKIREAVQKKVQEKLKEINEPAIVKKAFMGTVTQINTNLVTIEYQGVTKQLNVATDAVIIDKNRNKSTLEKLKVGQDILALGYFSGTGDLDTRRIVYMDIKTVANTSKVVLGKITDISQTTSIMILVDSKDKNTQYQIKTDKNTIITDKSSNKILLSSVSVGHRAAILISPETATSKSFIANRLISLDYQPSPTPTKKP